MPRATDTTFQAHPQEQWTDITIAQLQQWQSLNLSGFQTRVLLALKLYAWNGKTCFPSLDSIADRVGLHTKTRRQQVSNALKVLEGHDLIKRNHHRRKPDRFVLQRVKRNGEPNVKPDDEHKQTQPKEDSTPCSSPGGNTSTRKQRVRSSRRRKRIRKRDLQHIAEVEQNQQETIDQHNQSLESTMEQVPIVLQRILREHESIDSPSTTKGLERAYLIACVLHWFGWVEHISVHTPESLQRVSQLALIDEELIWSLRLNVYQLWEHGRKNQT